MALTDLTGTTWTLNSSLTSYAGGTYSLKTYSVNITTDTALPTYGGDADTFVMFAVGYDSGGEHNVAWLYTSTTTSYTNRASLATGNDTKTLPDAWTTHYQGTFTITGGTDATNSVLIAWLEDNCTESTPATPDVVVTYDGANIVELSEAGTKTLKTAGKYLTDDVVLAYSGGSGGGSTVTVTPILTSGTQTATISVDGTTSTLYAPTPPTASTATPLMDGTASYGSGAYYARSNHRHPTDTSRQATLVSGTNIKTINGASILGSGDITTPTYTLPTASTSTLGGVKVDGSTITITDGVISSSGGGGGYVTASGILYANSWDTLSNTNYLSLAELTTGSETVLVSPQSGSYTEYISCGVRCYDQTVGALGFVCTTRPTLDLSVNFIIFG